MVQGGVEGQERNGKMLFSYLKAQGRPGSHRSFCETGGEEDLVVSSASLNNLSQATKAWCTEVQEHLEVALRVLVTRWGWPQLGLHDLVGLFKPQNQ